MKTVVKGDRIGRVIIGEIKEDQRYSRPFYYKIVTLDLNDEARLVEYRRHYNSHEALIARGMTISQLKSLDTAARKRKRAKKK